MSVLKWVLVFVLQLPVSGLFAQSLTVLDEQTRLPVDNVLIYNTQKTTSTLTNPEGKAILSDFSVSDTLIFQHPASELLIQSLTSHRRSADFSQRFAFDAAKAIYPLNMVVEPKTKYFPKQKLIFFQDSKPVYDLE